MSSNDVSGCNQDQLLAAPDTSETCERGTQSSAGTLAITQPRGNRLVSEFVWTSARVGRLPFPRMAIVFLEKTHRGYFSGADPNEGHALNLVLFTKYKRNGQLFRLHPAYRGGLPCHDRAMFRYKKSAQDVARGKSYMEVAHGDEVHHGDPPDIAEKHHDAPGKILCFVEEEKKALMAVVLCCALKHFRSGIFATHWKVGYLDAGKTKPYVLLMDVEVIVQHCLMIPENKDGNGYHEVWEKERWAKEFV
jgi:hypothetical protein